MKDLDFDELDRAVNSIMSGTKGLSSTKEDATPTGETLPVSEPSAISTTPDSLASEAGMPVPMSMPVRSQQEPVTTMAESPKPQRMNDTERKTPVASRRGRFMDMVRPGAVQSNDPATARVSRQGSTIEPVAGPLVTDIIPSTATPPVAKKTPPIVTPAVSTTPSLPPKPTSTSAAVEWPDPLDMLQDDAPSRSSGDNEPLVSPFLSGTKVEKRPLGASLSQPSNEEALPTEVVEGTSEERESNLQLTPNPAADGISAPLPEELSNDVMALESDANTIAMPTDEVKNEVVRQVAEQEETPVSQSDSIKSVSAPEVAKKTNEPAEALPAKASVSSEPEPITPKGPISIPQQYREEPSTGDKGNGAIYDTDTYHHQPLAHPKKKKSGWLWVIWILLILVVGAACGAALYWLGVF